MKAVLVLVITWTVLVSEIVTTVQTASARGSRVSVTYVAPKDAAHQPILRTLEELRFLSKNCRNSSAHFSCLASYW